MGKGGCRVLMVLVSAAVVGLMMAGTAGGQMMSPSPAPSPGVDCSGALVSAANCFNYVSEGSNLTSPGSACCSSIEGLITNSPVCLCQLIANSGSLGIPVDRKRALGLPHACKFSAPPLSACSLLGVPIPGPSEAPAPAKSGGKAPMTSKTPASPSPSPGGGGGSSDCNAAYMSAFSCLDYITLGSNLTSPSSDCCSGVKNLVTKEPVCLCQLLGASSPPGISIDRKRALGLAGACKAPTLPPGYCSSTRSPTSAPEASEPTTGVSTIKGNSIRRFGFRPSVLLSAATAMFVTGATIAIF
ncbi:Non-specific lipid transfer protein GPI-anchored 2 [Nymphaea thermarum]|nr:Non-specific lipid transfer protein GPI-anchored 2 [Nymphaea thermarum]